METNSQNFNIYFSIRNNLPIPSKYNQNKNILKIIFNCIDYDEELVDFILYHFDTYKPRFDNNFFVYFFENIFNKDKERESIAFLYLMTTNFKNVVKTKYKMMKLLEDILDYEIIVSMTKDDFNFFKRYNPEFVFAIETAKPYLETADNNLRKYLMLDKKDNINSVMTDPQKSYNMLASGQYNEQLLWLEYLKTYICCLSAHITLGNAVDWSRAHLTKLLKPIGEMANYEDEVNTTECKHPPMSDGERSVKMDLLEEIQNNLFAYVMTEKMDKEPTNLHKVPIFYGGEWGVLLPPTKEQWEQFKKDTGKTDL